MNIELAQHGSRRWWKEGGNATWGFGVHFDWFGDVQYEEPDESELVGRGWCLSLMLGGWSLNVYSREGHRAIYGDEFGYRWFEVLRA